MLPRRRFGAVMAVASVLALATLATIPSTAAAVGPPLLEEDRRALEPEPSVVPVPRPSATPRPSSTPEPTPLPTPEPTPVGYDISYPQCGGPFPQDVSFAIVGVNGGRVYSANPCLGTGSGPSQLEWAGPEAQLYANTGNPGPRVSRFWPGDADGPQRCEAAEPDSLACDYVYGWNAAEYAHDVALDAYVDLGWAGADDERLPGAVTWWLDVEAANSWRADPTRNVAALQGMVDALTALGAAEVGFYSTPRLWDRITGGTDAFAAHPAWLAGASDVEDAADRCATEAAFTGGELRLVQWVADGFDANLRCDG